MPNQKIASEWVSFAERSFDTASLLNRENHFTDVIAIDIQQAIEKALKAVYAFHGEKIPRTHSLEILFSYVSQWINLADIDNLCIVIISDYYQTERYPGPKYSMPDREEINNSLNVARIILNGVKKYINQS